MTGTQLTRAATSPAIAKATTSKPVTKDALRKFRTVNIRRYRQRIEILMANAVNKYRFNTIKRDCRIDGSAKSSRCHLESA